MEKQLFKRILLAITYAIALFFVLNHLPLVWEVLQAGFAIAMPFIFGGCVAFILSIPMSFFERKIFRFEHHPRLRRMRRVFSLLMTLIIFSGILVAVVFIVMPELAKTFQNIGASVPGFVQGVYDWVNTLNVDWKGLETWLAEIQLDLNGMLEKLASFAQNSLSGVFTSMVGVVTSVAQGVINVVVGIIFSVYVLFAKESIIRQGKKLLYAFLKVPVGDKLLRIARLSHRTFSKFFTGQCLEALILGLLFYISLTIFRMPYALLISVLIAVTALIPIFGAFIGCAVGAFLIIMVNPMQAFWFIVLFLILQQVEGNFIYPHVVGNSVGLPPIWVLIAVTLGGGFFGIFGMLLFIPLVSVLYTVSGEAIDNRLRGRGIKPAKWLQHAKDEELRPRIKPKQKAKEPDPPKP